MLPGDFADVLHFKQRHGCIKGLQERIDRKMLQWKIEHF